MRKTALIGTALVGMFVLSGCETDADVASRNISTAAENFEVQRRVTVASLITDTVLLEIEGRCSWESTDNKFAATCKHGPNDIRRHDFTLGANSITMSEQLEAIDVSEYRTRIVIKPESLLPPTIDVETSAEDASEGN